MSFFSKAIDIAKGGALKAASSFIPTGLSTAFDLGGRFLENQFINKPNSQYATDMSRVNAKEAFERSYGAYKSRYQDTARDMKAAGINPIMAASSGFQVGNAVNAPIAQSFQPHQPNINAVNSGKTLQEQQKIKAETVKTFEQALKIRAETGLATANEKKAVQDTQNLKRNMVLMAKQINLTQQKIKESRSKVELTDSKIAETNVNIKKIKEQKLKIIKEAQKLGYESQKLKRVADVYASPSGKILVWINEILGSLGINVGLIKGLNTKGFKGRANKYFSK